MQGRSHGTNSARPPRIRHYRARALWNLAHGGGAKRGRKKQSKSADNRVADAFTLKQSRDAWVKGAYTPGTAEFRARTQLAGG